MFVEVRWVRCFWVFSYRLCLADGFGLRELVYGFGDRELAMGRNQHIHHWFFFLLLQSLLAGDASVLRVCFLTEDKVNKPLNPSIASTPC